MNKRGSALLLVLVLTTAVLPAAGTLIYIARSDLASALDDYHNVKAMSAARAVIALAEEGIFFEDIMGDWPDPDVIVTVKNTDTADGRQIVVSAQCGRAAAHLTVEMHEQGTGN